MDLFREWAECAGTSLQGQRGHGPAGAADARLSHVRACGPWTATAAVLLTDACFLSVCLGTCGETDRAWGGLDTSGASQPLLGCMPHIDCLADMLQCLHDLHVRVQCRRECT